MKAEDFMSKEDLHYYYTLCDLDAMFGKHGLNDTQEFYDKCLNEYKVKLDTFMDNKSNLNES